MKLSSFTYTRQLGEGFTSGKDIINEYWTGNITIHSIIVFYEVLAEMTIRLNVPQWCSRVSKHPLYSGDKCKSDNSLQMFLLNMSNPKVLTK